MTITSLCIQVCKLIHELCLWNVEFWNFYRPFSASKLKKNLALCIHEGHKQRRVQQENKHSDKHLADIIKQMLPPRDKKKYRKKELTTKTCLPRSPMITWTGIKQSETGEHKKQSQKVFRTQELAAYVAEAPGHLLTQDCQKLPFTEGWNTFLAPRPTSIQLKWST